MTEGTLQLGNGGATGSLSGNSAVQLFGTGSLVVKRNTNVAQASSFGVVSGTGTLVQDGRAYNLVDPFDVANSNNRLTLSGTNTYSGGTILRNGQIKVLGVNSAGTGALILEAGVFDMNNLALTNPLVLSGGRLANADKYAGTSGIPAGATFTLDYTLPGNVAVTGDLVIKTGGAITGATIAIGTAGSSGASLNLNNFAGNFAVTANQTFKGSGTIDLRPGQKLAVAGTWAAGNSIGTNTVSGDLELAGNVEIELGTPGSLALGTYASANSDRTMVDGKLTLTGASTLKLKPTTDVAHDGAHGAGAFLIFSGASATQDGFEVSGQFGQVETLALGSGPDALHAKVTYDISGTTTGNPITGYVQVFKVTDTVVSTVEASATENLGGTVLYVTGQPGVVDVTATYLANGYTLVNGVLTAPAVVNKVLTTTSTISTNFTVGGSTYTNVTVNEIDVTKTTTAGGTVVYLTDQPGVVDVAATYLQNGYTFVNGLLTAPSTYRPLVVSNSATTTATFTDTTLRVDDLSQPIRTAGAPVKDHKVILELYRLAAVTAPSTSLSLGNTRRGGVLAGSIPITNTAGADGYSEALIATANRIGTTFGSALAGGATGRITVAVAAPAAGLNSGTTDVTLFARHRRLRRYRPELHDRHRRRLRLRPGQPDARVEPRPRSCPPGRHLQPGAHQHGAGQWQPLLPGRPGGDHQHEHRRPERGRPVPDSCGPEREHRPPRHRRGLAGRHAHQPVADLQC